MDIINQVFRFLWRIKYWLVIIPIIVTLFVVYLTRDIERTYTVSTTIYTGIASGYDIETDSDAPGADWNAVNNGLDNLINIIKSRNTLRNVSLRLYAQHMIEGDSTKDNQFIKRNNFREIYRITPKEVRLLIDKSSITKTVENLKGYEKATNVNFVYGLLNWYHPHYSYSALEKIDVKRLFNSDMLEIRYSANDPGIAFNTLEILNEEFINEYKRLRFGETFNVIAYFQAELDRLGKDLKLYEDGLIKYNIDNKVINYPEQTKQIAALSRDFELKYEEILLTLTSSTALVNELNQRIQDQAKLIENNRQFIDKLKEISGLSGSIARLESFQSDSLATSWSKIAEYKMQRDRAEAQLKLIVNSLTDKQYSKEGIALSEFVNEWLSEIIKREKATAELAVMNDRKKLLDNQYIFFSPIGSTLRRMEREISFKEQSYLNILHNLNQALMKQKNLEMTSATLKALNPPLYPIDSEKTNRKQMTAIAFIGSFLFVLGFFTIIELLDRTLRDKFRTERLVHGSFVLGARPSAKGFRFSKYKSVYNRLATTNLANSIVPYLNPKERPDIINIVSLEYGVGKSAIINELTDYWTERGLRVKFLSWNEDIDMESREFILANNIGDVYEYDSEDIIIIEHKPIVNSAIPQGLLKEASINITVLRADRPWKDIDNLFYGRLQQYCGSAPLVLYLTNTRRDAAESFLGLLPPHNRLRTFIYKIIQFGLTSKS